MTGSTDFNFTWGMAQKALEELGYVQIYGFMLNSYAELGLTRDEFLCLTHLASYHYNSAKGESRPSLVTITKLMGYAHPNSVRRLVKSLESKKMIKITRNPGYASTYDASPFAGAALKLWLQKQDPLILEDTPTPQCETPPTPQCETPSPSSVGHKNTNQANESQANEYLSPSGEKLSNPKGANDGRHNIGDSVDAIAGPIIDPDRAAVCGTTLAAEPVAEKQDADTPQQPEPTGDDNSASNDANRASAQEGGDGAASTMTTGGAGSGNPTKSAGQRPDNGKGDGDEKGKVDALCGIGSIGGIADKVLSGQDKRTPCDDLVGSDIGNEPATIHADMAGLGSEHGGGEEAIPDDSLRACSGNGGSRNGDRVVKPDMWDLARQTEQAQQREGEWTTPDGAASTMTTGGAGSGNPTKSAGQRPDNGKGDDNEQEKVHVASDSGGGSGGRCDSDGVAVVGKCDYRLDSRISTGPVLADRVDYLQHCAQCAGTQQREGAWSVPPEAGGADPWQDGPVDVFCQVLAGIDPLKLPSKRRGQWARELARIAGENTVDDFVITPGIMIDSIRAIPNTRLSHKVYTNPFAGNFDKDVAPLLLNGGEIPEQLKPKGNSHGSHQRNHIAPGAVQRQVASAEEARAILGDRYNGP
jgi:hypothetical protein